jgi:Diacylglycerol kinase catalytic domain
VPGVAAVTSATAGPAAEGRPAERWLARASLALAGLAVVIVGVFAGLRSIAMLAVGLAAAVSLAAAYFFLSRRGVIRWLALAAHPYLIMNPKSGGGKVGKFGLKRKAEELGAEVFLMEGPEPANVAEVARKAVADGADLLGVAGGDGTQVPRDRPGAAPPKPPLNWGQAAAPRSPPPASAPPQ